MTIGGDNDRHTHDDDDDDEDDNGDGDGDDGMVTLRQDDLGMLPSVHQLPLH